MLIERFGVVLTASLLASTRAFASLTPQYRSLPSLREQTAIQDAWRTERLSRVPDILRKHGVDAWLMSQREYAEDTVFWSLKCATQFSARRRTVYLFFADAASGLPTEYRLIDNTNAIWGSIRTILEQHHPSSIAINIDSDISFAGGLHVGLYHELCSHLGPSWSDKFIAAPMVAVEYIATMPASQLHWYKRLQETTWALISETFSSSVVTPGTTTTTDVEWWLREKVQALNYSTWFQPDVTIVGQDEPFGLKPWGMSCSHGSAGDTIFHGDLLHVDFGVTAMGLNTDTQHLAYVLHPSETSDDIPKGILEGMKKVNRLQDIVRENMIIGHSGNEILNASLAQMRSEGIEGKIYCHPIGDWGHSAGTLIGMCSPNLQRLVMYSDLSTNPSQA